ncbi:oocyte zinc finger protein XlCOF8.4-like [Hyperolius riggenbachi]|uniref:oocyte zinc finger protein XlCOF8.4-like n=1 Tax=Hyperolius riggenbachi TaxID=752182 RepID=UPI0035A2F12C
MLHSSHEEQKVTLDTAEKMERNQGHMIVRLLDLTLEIIYLLTGEDYTVVRKTCDADVTPPKRHAYVSGGWNSRQNHIMEPSSSFLNTEKNNKEILKVTNRIIQLLTGEVPIRCEDVTVYFSMEEWGYVEGHKDLYKDVMMENQAPLTPSITGPSDRSQPLDSPLEHYTFSHHDQLENHANIKAQYDVDSVLFKEPDISADIKTGFSKDGQYRSYYTEENSIITQNGELNDVTAYSSEENTITPNFPPVLHSANMMPDPFPHGIYSPIQSNTGARPTSRRRGETYPCPECGKCFTQKGHLRRHQSGHTGFKRYSCSECGKCFTRKENFTDHQRIHGGQPYACSECGKDFIWKSSLMKHMKGYHSNTKV